MPLLLDGAIGTELFRAGISNSECLEALALRKPGIVRAIHRVYRDAGADIISTVTFGANRFRLAAHGLEDQVRAINVAAVRAARAEARGGLVAGTIGPSGIVDGSAIWIVREAFVEQGEALTGVDLFLLETFGDVEEIRVAILALRAISDIPIVAHVTFGPDRRTLAGQSVQEVVATLGHLPIDALGVNCAIGEHTSEMVLSEFGVLTDLPLSVEPNAGKPVSIAGKSTYPTSPAMFAAQVTRLRPLVSLHGGCCGITPEHISAARAALDA